jgi:hypothetical protein
MRPHELPEGIGLAEIDIGEKELETAKHPRWNRPYTELAYQPMLNSCATCVTTNTRPISSPAMGKTSCASAPSRFGGKKIKQDFLGWPHKRKLSAR